MHIPNDRDLALNGGLFKDDFETESHKANGFQAYDDFLEFGKRIGITEVRTQKIIESFSNSPTKVHALIERSFLSAEMKQKYTDLFNDKLRAITYSFKGRK